MFDRIQQRLLQYITIHAVGMYKEQLDIHDYRDMQDTQSSAEKRAEELTARMTLDEKISYIGGYDDLAIRGIGRLGIPTVYASDATSGIRCFSDTTAFPSGLALTASWNRRLICRVGDAIGEEARAQGVSILLGPGVNIARVPTCGRNFEYMGEDPYLAGEMAASYIQGVQGRGVITTVKHFACNNSDYDRHKSDSVVDERTLHEIYLPAFKKAVQQGGSLGLMSSYNQINGVYASEHAYLLTEVLRDRWGFDGFVMSDWNSVYSTAGPVKHGLDIEMPAARWLTEKRVKQEITQGTLNEKDLDAMVYHLLYTLIRAGIFDRTAVDAEAQTRSREVKATSRAAADEGVVLLKNRGSLLPLDKSELKRLVVLGRNGLVPATGGGGSSYMIPHPEMHGIYDALRLMAPEADVTYIDTVRGLVDEQDIYYLSGADAVVLAVGFDHVTESEGYDRSWELPDHEERLIEQVAAVNANCIVILHGGGAMQCASWIDVVSAVLHGMYLGEQAGDAIARMIYGETNPSGKLPFSMVKNWDDMEAARWYIEHPEHMNILRAYGPQGNPKVRRVTPMEYGEKLMVGYRHLDTNGIEPLFPFGFGLSYTTFAIDAYTIEKKGETIEISCRVKNTGKTEGSEVVQVYVHDVGSSVIRPLQELKGFEKVRLMPDEEKTVRISLARDAFCFYDVITHDWILEPGIFEIRIGTSSRDIRYREELEITHMR